MVALYCEKKWPLSRRRMPDLCQALETLVVSYPEADRPKDVKTAIAELEAILARTELQFKRAHRS